MVCVKISAGVSKQLSLFVCLFVFLGVFFPIRVTAGKRRDKNMCKKKKGRKTEGNPQLSFQKMKCSQYVVCYEIRSCVLVV